MFGRELGYFLTIVEEQSVSKAAARLFMSQPALSLFLGRLECQVGRKLFYRSGSGLILTHAGKCFAAMARKMEKASRDFEMQMSSADESFIGHLQIGTSPHIGSYVLPSVLPLFKKRYPNIEVLLTEGNSKVLESLIAGNQLDAALLHLPLKDVDADYTLIKQERYVAAFAKGHRAEAFMYRKESESRPFIKPEVLAREDFVLSFPFQRVRQIGDRILRKAGIFEPRIVLTTSSVQTALRFAEAGMGVTFLPESYLKLFPCTHEPNLCYMEDRYGASWSFVVAYPKGAELSAPVQYFIQLAKESFM